MLARRSPLEVGVHQLPADFYEDVLFTVDGTEATKAKSIHIEDLGLTEPHHLEQWVTQYPETLGSGVMIVASQYDQWVGPDGAAIHDRLDLLGLDTDGRLVVAELKRGRAPETVDLQAIKYAAMTSRFTIEKLAELHALFLERTTQDQLTNEEAQEKLQAHMPDVELTTDVFRSPRVVLLAETFPDTTTTSVIWLSEQGVDITLRRYRAYETGGGETMVSVSQLYPVADVGVVGPGRGERKRKPKEDLPEEAWTVADFQKLIDLGFVVPIEALNACSEKPGEWIGSSKVFERASVEPPKGRGQMAGFGFSVRTTFGRSNPPWEAGWNVGGEHMSYYRIDDETADRWLTALEPLAPDVEPLTGANGGSGELTAKP